VSRKVSGVYLILNLVDWKIYIGASIDVHREWKHYKRLLRKGTHGNSRLQNAFQRYGEDNLGWYYLEEVYDRQLLVAAEQRWLDETQCYERDKGYNKKATANIHFGYRHSEETKEKIRRANYRYWGDPVSRFWSKVDKSEGPDACWVRQASADKDGYGYIRFNGKHSQKAHRVAWQITSGSIPRGMHVLHYCDNPCCVNPKHLFLGTNDDNMRDMVSKGRQSRGRSHCHAKLSERHVREIRRLSDKGVSHRVMAEKFSVTRACIGKAVRGETWGHVQ